MGAFQKMLSDEQRADLVRRVWRVVDALPQREAIRDADARAWIDAVVDAHGDEAMWHATRLAGFGGSEIGVLVRNRQGARADHGMSAHDIVEAKLMRRAPLEDTAHLRRGHDNEAMHAQKFWAKWGAQRDEQAYGALKAMKGSRAWMRYSPDDVVRMPFVLRERNGSLQMVATREPALWLIDYKAPAAVDPSDKVAFQYAAQLHQGAILCAEAGIDLEGMMLSQFDWAGWSLKDDVVEWDPALGQMIVEAGDYYWDFVLRGEVPPYVIREQWDGAESYAQRQREVAQLYAALAALADAAKERAEKVRDRLLAPLASSRLGSAKIEIEGSEGKLLTITANRVLDKDLASQLLTPQQMAACTKSGSEAEWDADAMARCLREMGVDVERFKRRRLDPDKVFALAAQMGLDPERLVREQLMVRVAPNVKQAMRDYLDEVYPLEAVMQRDDSDASERQA